MYFLIGLILFAFVILYFIATSTLAPVPKFIIALIELGIVGSIMQKSFKPTKNFKIEGDWGLLLLKTKKGLKYIDNIARNTKLWNFIADSGLVVGYGFFSLLIMRKHLDWKKFIFGMAVLTALVIFVVPSVIPFLLVNLKGQVVAESSSSEAAVDIVSTAISFIVTYGFGLFGVVFSGIVQYGAVIITKIIGVLLGTETLSSDSAGVTLIIPGINIPLVEGIIALIVILVVHEGAHAILGRVAKVPMESTGLVLFGMIPIGAFVEPNEQWLERLEKAKQTRVMVAGATANFLAAVLFFVLFIGFIGITGDYKEKGMFITQGIEGIEQGSIIYTINGVEIGEEIELVEGETVIVITNNGAVEVIVNEEGLLGVYGYHLNGSSIIVKYNNWIMNFIYVTLGLIFSLNFVIGTVNLLPIPAFDGYRIIELNIKRKWIVKGLMYLSIIGLIANFLPWLF